MAGREARVTVDVSVVGLGVAGSAIARSCARLGLVTDGFERSPAHVVSGASGGESKILRSLELGGMSDAGLSDAARAHWTRLGSRHPGVVRQTGGWVVGPPESPVIVGALAHACREPGWFEVMERTALSRRLPFADFDPGTIGIRDVRARVVDPERAVLALRAEAIDAGARLHFERPVDPETVRAETVVVAMGVGMTRNGVTGIRAEHFVEIRLNAEGGLGSELLMWPHPDGLYAIVPSPRYEAGTKIVCAVGRTHPLSDADIEHERDVALAWLSARCPRASVTVRETARCAYAWTDRNVPVIERVGRTIIVATCCGGGFKSAMWLSEHIAEWIATGERPKALAPYAL